MDHPAAPPSARERSASALADRQCADIDDQPGLQADLRARLLAQAERAAAADG